MVIYVDTKEYASNVKCLMEDYQNYLAKRKEANKKYRKSEKGKKAQKEASRRYYLKKKAEKIAKKAAEVKKLAQAANTSSNN